MALSRPGAATGSGISLIQANNLTASFPSIVSSLSGTFCSGNNNPLSDGHIETHWLAVPMTTTVLKIFLCTGLTIDRNLIRETIAVARIHMDEQLDIYGDRALLDTDDPYNTPVVADMNCTIEIHSQRTRTGLIPNHLTYQITLNALRGLFLFLYTDNHAASAVTEVFDPGLTGTMSRIGLISISPYE